MDLVNCGIEEQGIENPIGIMSTEYREPDQIIQPYYFGDEFQKTTCLWLKNLPKLFHAKEVDLFNSVVTHVGNGDFVEFISAKGKKIRQPKWYVDALKLPAEDRSNVRSKTFPGIAKAMAEQWG